MANSLSPLNPENWKPIVQDYLNNMLTATKIANVRCEKYLRDGDQVNFPYVSDVRVQDYTPGTDVTIDAINGTQDSLIVNQSKVATFYVDPQEEKQARADYGMELAYQSAFQLKNNIDQAVLNTGIAAAQDTVAGGNLTASTLFAKVSDVGAQLSRNNAADGRMFGVLDPENLALLEQTMVANAFEMSDYTLKNGYKGMFKGFDIYVSNNLPYSVSLTVDTQPTATDTFTIYGVTWTVVADGTAAAAGEINRGANLADFQAIFVTAINGSTPPSADDYIDVSVDNRRKYQNGQVAASAFAANVTTITAFGKIGATETFTAATNIFGTETSNLLFGRTGAISMALQMQPSLYIKDEPKQLGKNYITHTLYGTKVFTRDALRLVNLSFNVQ